MYRSLQQSARSVAAAVALTASVPALAGMGNTANTYGLFPVDVGTAQAMSMFNAQASALYYNPAYLTMDPRGELTAGLLHGEQELKSDDTVVNDTRSQQQELLSNLVYGLRRRSCLTDPVLVPHP